MQGRGRKSMENVKMSEKSKERRWEGGKRVRGWREGRARNCRKTAKAATEQLDIPPPTAQHPRVSQNQGCKQICQQAEQQKHANEPPKQHKNESLHSTRQTATQTSREDRAS